MRTPDEIKRGLDHCCEDGCKDCPYEQDCTMTDGFSELARDSLVYIQQLEADNAQHVRCIENLTDKLNTTNDALPRWISVENRLPDKMKYVLVFKQRNDHSIYPVAMWHIEIDWRGEDRWSRNPDNGYFDVTHWMPLPAPPPKEE